MDYLIYFPKIGQGYYCSVPFCLNKSGGSPLCQIHLFGTHSCNNRSNYLLNMDLCDRGIGYRLCYTGS